MGIFYKLTLDYLAGSVAGIGLGLLLVPAFMKWFDVAPQTFTLPGAIVAGLGASIYYYSRRRAEAVQP